MFDAAQPCSRDVCCRYRDRKVGGHVESKHPRLVQDGEVGLAGEPRLHLDEVRPALMGEPDPLPPLLRRADGVRPSDKGVRPVENCASSYHARPEQRAGRDLALPLLPHRCWHRKKRTLAFRTCGADGIAVAPHAAHAGDAVSEEEREVDRARKAVVVQMHVHIPEPRNQVFAPGVHHLSTRDDPGAAGGSDLHDAVARNQDCLVAEYPPALHIHNIHMCKY
jgi:hypothetical protein